MPSHRVNRAHRGGRAEQLIRLASPLLDLVLIIGERISRLLEPEDRDYVPARMARDGEAAPRGLRHPVRRPGS
jgi:hypothetical protein